MGQITNEEAERRGRLKTSIEMANIIFKEEKEWSVMYLDKGQIRNRQGERFDSICDHPLVQKLGRVAKAKRLLLG